SLCQGMSGPRETSLSGPQETSPSGPREVVNSERPAAAVQRLIEEMTGSRFTGRVAFTLMLLGVCGRAGAQQPEAASARSAVSATPTADSAPEDGSLPVSLDRIRAGLSRTSVLVLDHQPVFRSGVVEYRPRGFDLPGL